jgi:hypothetical protein
MFCQKNGVVVFYRFIEAQNGKKWKNFSAGFYYDKSM